MSRGSTCNEPVCHVSFVSVVRVSDLPFLKSMENPNPFASDQSVSEINGGQAAHHAHAQSDPGYGLH